MASMAASPGVPTTDALDHRLRVHPGPPAGVPVQRGRRSTCSASMPSGAPASRAAAGDRGSALLGDSATGRMPAAFDWNQTRLHARVTLLLRSQTDVFRLPPALRTRPRAGPVRPRARLVRCSSSARSPAAPPWPGWRRTASITGSIASSSPPASDATRAPRMPAASLWPQPANCADCHDGAIEETVEWAPPPAPRASNLKFTHPGHAEEVRRATRPIPRSGAAPATREPRRRSHAGARWPSCGAASTATASGPRTWRHRTAPAPPATCRWPRRSASPVPT